MKSVKIDKDANTYPAKIRAVAKWEYINTIKLTAVNDHITLDGILRDAVLDPRIEPDDYSDIQHAASFQGWGSANRLGRTMVG